jgi:hypothetical protein
MNNCLHASVLTLRMHGGGVLNPFLKALPEVQGNEEVGENPWTSI